jgi:hypothetical protein
MFSSDCLPACAGWLVPTLGKVSEQVYETKYSVIP